MSTIVHLFYSRQDKSGCKAKLWRISIISQSIFDSYPFLRRIWSNSHMYATRASNAYNLSKDGWLVLYVRVHSSCRCSHEKFKGQVRPWGHCGPHYGTSIWTYFFSIHRIGFNQPNMVLKFCLTCSCPLHCFMIVHDFIILLVLHVVTNGAFFI